MRTPAARPALEPLEGRLVPSAVAANFASGLWRYDTTAGWSHLSAAAALQIDVDDAGNVFAQFNNAGLWRWSPVSGWMKLSALNVGAYEVNAAGVLYAHFPGSGLWRWSPAGDWSLLSGGTPGLIAVSDADVFFGRFDSAGQQGTWRWTPASGWSLLSGSRPNQMQADDQGNLVAVYTALGQQGTWRWSPTAGWARLSTAAPFAIEVSASGVVYENRNDAGIWRWAPGGKFVQLASHDSGQSNLVALPDGGLYEHRYHPGSPDLFYSGWYWSPATQGLGFVKFLSETVQRRSPAVGKDGDLFFSGGGDDPGFFRWSLGSAYVALGGSSTSYLVGQS